MTRTKHCRVIEVLTKEGSHWKIYLQIDGFLQGDDFQFGLPLDYNFDTMEKAIEFAKTHIDKYIDEGLKDIVE
jgi:hypothetical protein